MRHVAAFAVCLSCLVIAGPASAQRPSAEERARGIERCKANRGVDCDTPEGQREWIEQERPITDEQRRAAAARRAREQAQQKCGPGASRKGGC